MPNVTRSDASTRGSIATCSDAAESERRRLENQGGERNQHDDRQIGERRRDRRREAGQRARRLEGSSRSGRRTPSMQGLHDLVEHAAVGEVLRLRLLPAAEGSVDGDEVDLGEAREVVLVGVFGIARAGSSSWRSASAPRAYRGSSDRPRRPCACPWRRRCRRPARPAARPGSTATARRSRTGPCRIPGRPGRRRSPRRSARRRGRAGRR